MTVCPSASPIRCARMRPATSVEPPGGNGTISVMVRDGKVSARTGAAHATATKTSIMAALRIRMIPPLLEKLIGRV